MNALPVYTFRDNNTNDLILLRQQKKSNITRSKKFIPFQEYLTSVWVTWLTFFRNGFQLSRLILKQIFFAILFFQLINDHVCCDEFPCSLGCICVSKGGCFLRPWQKKALLLRSPTDVILRTVLMNSSHEWRALLTLPMLRLLSSKEQGCKDFWKPSKPCQVGIHWIALAEYSQMSTHLPGFQ